MPDKELSEDLQKVLYDLVLFYEREDEGTRKEQIKEWKRNNNYWAGVQQIFWDELKDDWQSPAQFMNYNSTSPSEEGPFYDFVMNIYKAHGESIIAALSTSIPTVRFPPDDAEDDNDIQTSKTYDRIADLIQRHNKAKLLLLSALFILWNEGNVCAYHASKTDKEFGTTRIPQYRNGLVCPACGFIAPENYAPVPQEDGSSMENECPQCHSPMEPSSTVVSGYVDTPKSRVIIELHGPLFVKFSYYAKKQKDTPYIVNEVDKPTALLKYLFPDKADKIGGQYGRDDSERSARAPILGSSVDNDSRHNTTYKRCWLRPFVFAGLRDNQEAERKELEKRFPEGVYVAFADDVYLESRNEDMDRHWTIGGCGLSNYIHNQPLGNPIIPVQELTNVLVNLTTETIEQGIPSTFAETEVLDFNAYNSKEARPGMVYPVTPKPGQPLNQSFHETGRATLSREVPEFQQQLEHLAQFLGGSFPSIFGGTMDSASRTASEYSQSRQMALQRLTIVWNKIVDWWCSMVERCVKLFIENMTDDEVRFTKKQDNNYINVFIRKSELTGTVGDVEPEGDDTFPVSMAQKQALIIKLLEMKDQFLAAAIFDPANRSILADLLGFPEFTIPGEDQRIKQTTETQQMIKGEPVEVDPLIDDHSIHIVVLTHYMVGTEGLDLKRTNPQAYAMLSQHLEQHKQIQEQDQMKQMMMQGAQQNGPPSNNGNPANKQ